MADLTSGRKKSKWFKAVTVALAERRLLGKVRENGADVVATRRNVGVAFAQFCFHKHLNCPTQTSADDFRAVKPFGVYPFLYKASPEVARYLFSFVLCNWRWLDRGKCKNYPRTCSSCRSSNSAWHILFECPIFFLERERFQGKTLLNFDYNALLVNDGLVARTAAETGKMIFDHLCALLPA
jgi:hypothetical protein